MANKQSKKGMAIDVEKVREYLEQRIDRCETLYEHNKEMLEYKDAVLALFKEKNVSEDILFFIEEMADQTMVVREAVLTLVFEELDKFEKISPDFLDLLIMIYGKKAVLQLGLLIQERFSR